MNRVNAVTIEVVVVSVLSHSKSRIRSRAPPIRNLAGCHHVFSYWDLLVLHGCQSVILIASLARDNCVVCLGPSYLSPVQLFESVLRPAQLLRLPRCLLPASIHLTLATNAAVWSKHGMLFTAHSRLVYSGHRLVDIGTQLFR